MNASSALQLGNEQYLLGLEVEFPYDLAGISVRTRSDRAKTFCRKLAEPCLSGCDSTCVSRIKFVACIARVVQHDLHVHLMLRLWMDSAKATRVVSSCSPAPSEPVARRSWKGRVANRAPARQRQASSSGR